MEFIEEESRPRFIVQSRIPSSSNTKLEIRKINKVQVAICFSISSLIFLFLFVFSLSETLALLLIWLATSLIVGPFAPISVTGGDISVGKGEIVDFPDEEPREIEDSKKRNPKSRTKTRKNEEAPKYSFQVFDPISTEETEKKLENSSYRSVEQEKEWTDEEYEILKKQILKHPIGEPGRWELIAEAFKGKHGLESVIKTAKSLSERKPGEKDAFAQFLKQRKPLNKKLEAAIMESLPDVPKENDDTKKDNSSVDWSSSEDIALLNAMKIFTKDISMRWEKIAASVPGKSKAGCMKRASELKRNFRNSKAAAES